MIDAAGDHLQCYDLRRRRAAPRRPGPPPASILRGERAACADLFLSGPGGRIRKLVVDQLMPIARAMTAPITAPARGLAASARLGAPCSAAYGDHGRLRDRVLWPRLEGEATFPRQQGGMALLPGQSGRSRFLSSPRASTRGR